MPEPAEHAMPDIIPTTNILMVGPSGVGKTSLLSAMSEVMEREAAALGANFHGIGQTDIQMRNKRAALRSLIEKGGMVASPESSLQGDRQRTDYTFGVDVEPSAKEGDHLRLCFTDVPGGWFTDGRSDVEEALRTSHLSFIVVDANALLEQPKSGKNCGRFHHALNRPDLIAAFYKRALSFPMAGSPPPYVVFVLVRAETYMDGNLSRREDMHQALQESYAELLDVFDQYGVDHCVSVIKTIGGIRFSHFDEVSNPGQHPDPMPVANFMVKKNVGYAPEFCDAPLKLALTHAAKVAHDGTTLLDDFLDWFGWGKKPKLRNFIERMGDTLDDLWLFELRRP